MEVNILLGIVFHSSLLLTTEIPAKRNNSNVTFVHLATVVTTLDLALPTIVKSQRLGAQYPERRYGRT